jgi:hypothetical protein
MRCSVWPIRSAAIARPQPVSQLTRIISGPPSASLWRVSPDRLYSAGMLGLCALGLLTILAVHRPKSLLPVLVLVGVLTSRPTAIGQRYPALGGAILILCGLAAALRALRLGIRVHVRVSPYVVLLLMWCWLSIHQRLVPGSEPSLLRTWITFFGPLIAFFAIALDPVLLARVRRLLVGTITAVAALTCCAVLLGVWFGFARISVATLPLSYQGSNTRLLLPGALTYGTQLGSGIPRFLGIGREPGMGAIFIGWAFFALPSGWKRSGWLRAVLLAALLATQSTTGIGIFGACWVLQQTFGLRRFSPLRTLAFGAVGAALSYVAIYNPSFGLLAKINVNGLNSYSSRQQAASLGWEAIRHNPFRTSNPNPLASVNLIAGAAAHGLPWLVLAALFLFMAVFRRGCRASWQPYAGLFMLIVFLTSQPFPGTTAVLVLALVGIHSPPDLVPLRAGPSLHVATPLSRSAVQQNLPVPAS